MNEETSEINSIFLSFKSLLITVVTAPAITAGTPIRKIPSALPYANAL
jgi:hypothetical protein